MRTRKLLLGLAMSAILLVGFLAQAIAVPIAAGSQLNIVGVDVASITSTQVTFTSTKASVSGLSGSFSAFGNCTACATMASPLVYSPFTAGSVYSAINGAEVTSFTVTSQLSAPVFSNVGGIISVTITDAGTASLTGFDPTSGEFIFTGNTINGLTGSFSATAAAVSEPGSILILLMALTSLVLVGYRRQLAAFLRQSIETMA